MSKDIMYHQNIREKLLMGTTQLTNTVKVTYGPKGRNVLIEKPSDEPPLLINSGTEIANEITLNDSAENLGVQVMLNAAAQTKETAGNGTSSTLILTQAIIQEGMKNIAAGANPIILRRGIQKAAACALDAIKKMVRQISISDEITQLASNTAQDEEIGQLISEALALVGREGMIHIESANGTDSYLENSEGLLLDRGFLTPYMATNPKTMTTELNHPFIFITDYKLNSIQEIIPVLELAAMEERPILIIAEEVGEQVLGLIYRNKTEGDMDIVAIHPPAYGDGRKWRMEDLALQTGGIFVSENLGISLKNITLDMLGTAQKVIVHKQSTTIYHGGGNPTLISEREKQLRNLVETTDYEFNKKRYAERLAHFVSGIVTVYIGAYTDFELKTKKSLAEDALLAVYAAIDNGILPGGGIAYLEAIPFVESSLLQLEGEEKLGAKIVSQALEAPFRQLLSNGGFNAGTILEKIKDLPSGTGFDVCTEQYMNMLDAGIFDTAKSVCSALQNAVSAASTLLTTEAGLTTKGGNRDSQ